MKPANYNNNDTSTELIFSSSNRCIYIRAGYSGAGGSVQIVKIEVRKSLDMIA